MARPTKLVNGERVSLTADEIAERKADEANAAAEAPARFVTAVKAEAARRILAIIPEWKQRNLTAQAANLAIKGRANWDQADQDAYAAGLAIWQEVERIRARSNAIEKMDVATNPTDDALWASKR